MKDFLDFEGKGDLEDFVYDVKIERGFGYGKCFGVDLWFEFYKGLG